MTTATTTTAAAHIVTMARDIATEYGAREWLNAPELTENAWGGYDVRPHRSDRTYRVIVDDETIVFYVFCNGNAMIVESEARLSLDLAHMVAREIGEALR